MTHVLILLMASATGAAAGFLLLQSILWIQERRKHGK
jgi:hypothetical protein